MPYPPKAVLIKGQPLAPTDFDFADGTLRIRFPNSPDGVAVEIRW